MFHRRIRAGSVPLLLLLASARAALPLAAETPPGPRPGDDPQLAALIVEALEKSPEVSAAREAAEAARQRVSPAAALPDPMVTLGYENDGSSFSLGTMEFSRLQLMAQQAFPFPGKQRLAGRVAASEADVVSTRTARARLSIEAAVRRAWIDLVAARDALRLLEEQAAAWEGIEEITRGRYAAGLGNQQDVLRAQGERTRLAQQRLRDESAAEEALLELSRLLSRSVEGLAPADRLVPGSLPPVPARTEAIAAAEDASPELKEARLARESAKLRADLAGRATSPDFVASASYSNRLSLPMMWSVGVGVSVPLWAGEKQRPLIVEAKAAERAAASSEESVLARLRARTAARLVRMERLAKEARLDAEGILVQDRLSVDSALAGYTTGGVPFVAVLEALGTLYQDRRAAIGRIAEFRRTAVELGEVSLDSAAGSAMALGASGSPSAAGAAGSTAPKM